MESQTLTKSTVFQQKAALAQGAVSTRRQFDFVQHTMLHRIDPSMIGKARLLTRYEGNVVTARSNMAVELDVSITRLDRGNLEIHVPGHVDMTGYLLLIAATEYVVVTNVEFMRDFTTFNKYTVLHLESALRASYPSGSSIDIYGFPLVPASWYNAGSRNLQFDSPVFCVAGDEIAVYSDPDGIPVIGAWCSIDSVLDAQVIVDSESRYHVQLAIPLQQDLTPETRLFLRAVPAYQSPIIPVTEEIQRRGSVLVDLMSGKVFGTGTDAVSLSVTLYDANKNVVSVFGNIAKNGFVSIGALACADLVFWRHRYGTTSIDSLSSLGATATCDETGVYQVGIVTPYPVDFGMRVRSSSGFRARVQTKSGVVEYDSVANTAVLECSHNDAEGGFVIITLLGSAFQTFSLVSSRQSVAQYISYGYRVAVSPTESWEGSGLLLKPTMPSLLDLQTQLQTRDEAGSVPTALAVDASGMSAGFKSNAGVLL